jgi:hypothetical protein
MEHFGVLHKARALREFLVTSPSSLLCCCWRIPFLRLITGAWMIESRPSLPQFLCPKFHPQRSDFSKSPSVGATPCRKTSQNRTIHVNREVSRGAGIFQRVKNQFFSWMYLCQKALNDRFLPKTEPERKLFREIERRKKASFLCC